MSGRRSSLADQREGKGTLDQSETPLGCKMILQIPSWLSTILSVCRLCLPCMPVESKKTATSRLSFMCVSSGAAVMFARRRGVNAA